MQRLLGLWTLLLVGCATQPDTLRTVSKEPVAEVDVAALDKLIRSFPDSGLRVGVEYLPPSDSSAANHDAPRVHPVRAEATAAPLPDHLWRYRRSESRDDRFEPTLGLALDAARIRTVENPVERMSLRFMKELMGEDRRRVDRALGGPIITQLARRGNPHSTMHDFVDERIREDHAQFVAKHGRKLLKRPLRHALKELRLVHKFEFEVKDFKAKNVPLSGEYQRLHDRREGRVSVRIRPHKFEDPMELTYMRSGWRLGSSLGTMKMGYRRYLTESTSLHLRSRYRYQSGNLFLLGSLRYDLSPNTRLNVTTGNRIDLLSTPAAYAGYEVESERSEGVLFYVQHIF